MYNAKLGGMSGTATPSRAPKGAGPEPGPGAYTPTVLRNGVNTAPGSDAPSWKLSDRQSKKRFISKVHSAIDFVSDNPGPGAYSTRQWTSRGQRELLQQLTHEHEKEEDDEAPAKAKAEEAEAAVAEAAVAEAGA